MAMVIPSVIATSDIPMMNMCAKGKYENILRIIIPIATKLNTENACKRAAPVGNALLYIADLIVWNGGRPVP